MRSITIAQARKGEERGRGIPLTDIERACRHYGITPDQYLACPECYPLPERGAGLIGALPEGNWQLVTSEITPEGQFYIGTAEQCTFEFSWLPEEFPGASWLAEQVSSGIREATELEKGRLLSYKLYLDRSALFYSRWLLVVVVHASPFNWAAMALILAGLLLVYLIIREIKNLPYVGPAIILIGVGVAAGGVAALLKRGEK